MNPLYCGVLTTETLLMNRRRHTLSCRKKRLSGKTLVYRLDTSERRAAGDSDYAEGSSGDYAEIGDQVGK